MKNIIETQANTLKNRKAAIEKVVSNMEHYDFIVRDSNIEVFIEDLREIIKRM